MNIRWQKIQDKINLTVDYNGIPIQWLQRVTSGSDSFDTGSTITYGYGDSIIFWITGSANAIVSELAGSEVVVEAGFAVEDYLRLQVKSDLDLKHWDMVIYPSGSGVFYHVIDPTEQKMGDIIISKYARIRRLLPKSGSLY